MGERDASRVDLVISRGPAGHCRCMHWTSTLVSPPPTTPVVQDVAAFVALLCLTVACTGRNIDLESSPDAGDGAVLNGDIVDPAWGCLGGARAHPTPDPPPAVVAYDTSFGSFANPAQSPRLLALSVCWLADMDCASPVQQVMGSLPQPIRMPLELPFGFQGYLRLESPDHAPAEYYLGGPMLGDALGESSVRGEPIALLDSDDLRSLSAAGGPPLDTSLGLLLLRAVDCQGRRAAGVQLSLSAGGVPWVLVNGLPVFSEDPRLSTDASGLVGFVNVPLGNLLIEGHIPATGARFGATALRVRAGSVTMAEIRPDYVYGR